MAKPSDSPGFRKLVETWDKKLKDSGFNDLETRSGNLKYEPLRRLKRYSLRVSSTRAEFFEVIGERLKRTDFEKEIEREIMQGYFEGMSQVEIKKSLGIDGHRYKVYSVIHKWLREWGLKK